MARDFSEYEGHRRGVFPLSSRKEGLMQVEYDATGLAGTNGTLLKFGTPVSELYLNADLMSVLEKLYDLRPDNLRET